MSYWDDCLRREVKQAFPAISAGRHYELWLEWFACDEVGNLAIFDAQFEGVVPRFLLEQPDLYFEAGADFERFMNRWGERHGRAVDMQCGVYQDMGLHVFTVLGSHQAVRDQFEYRKIDRSAGLGSLAASPVKLANIREEYPQLVSAASQAIMHGLDFRTANRINVNQHFRCSMETESG